MSVRSEKSRYPALLNYVMSDFILFLPKESNEVKKIPASDYEDEKMLQDLLEKHTELLPLSSGRIVTLASEYSITGGSIDLLCVDSKATIYIVETKLQKNTDRRQAIAQLIDYGAQLGKESFDTFQAKIRKKNRKSLDELLIVFGDEPPPEVDNIRQSLQRRDFRLILAMDRFEPTLRDAIIFLNYNNDNNDMEIYGIELQRHRRQIVKSSNA